MNMFKQVLISKDKFGNNNSLIGAHLGSGRTSWSCRSIRREAPANDWNSGGAIGGGGGGGGVATDQQWGLTKSECF